MISYLLIALLVASDASKPAESLQPTAKPAKVEKICRDLAPTGSRLSKKACKTAEEWVAFDEANRKKLGGATKP